MQLHLLMKEPLNIPASLLCFINIMDVICQAMAAEMHSWGASAVRMYLSFEIIEFFVGIWT